MSLNATFQAKLGWITGNIYSRVGTEDWTTKQYTEAEFDAAVNELANGFVTWVDDEVLRLAEQQKPEGIFNKDEDEIRSFIASVPVKKRKERALDRIVGLLDEMGVLAAQHEGKKVRTVLGNDPELASLLPK